MYNAAGAGWTDVDAAAAAAAVAEGSYDAVHAWSAKTVGPLVFARRSWTKTTSGGNASVARRDCAGGTPRSADECLARFATGDVGSHVSAQFLADGPTGVQAQARSDDDTARSASPGARLTRFHRANRWS